MLRRLSWTVALSLVLGAAWASAYGPFIPWSPVKPGYRTLRFERAEVSFPRSVPAAQGLLAIDRLVREGESFLGMSAPQKLRVVDCATWEDFKRFCLVRGRGVGAVTLDLGGVIYLSPRLAEKNLDKEEFLRHELVHAIVAENVTLWNLRKLRHHTWLYEGVPVWFGRQRSYVTRDEFFQRAAVIDLQPVMAYDANGGSPPPAEMRFAYIAWRYFIEYLVQSHGREAFDRFFHGYLGEPHRLDERFAAAFGSSQRAAVEAFQSAVRRRTFMPGE